MTREDLLSDEEGNCHHKHRASDIDGSTLIGCAESDIFIKKESFNRLDVLLTRTTYKGGWSLISQVSMNENAP
ncbi:hypothetical protein EUGRSUZ_J01910 [Eucalyptus grandis]|uniref:Uncharacterized protein n=2 Tax=Eucalyptus grandis TaxID=71139 RepID=A0ACC3J873_EUCGR|nr:hypothetical protein EUGRSUZ_J01910 [Eucalyptus grandis]